MSQTNFAQDVDRVCGPGIRSLPCLQITGATGMLCVAHSTCKGIRRAVRPKSPLALGLLCGPLAKSSPLRSLPTDSAHPICSSCLRRRLDTASPCLLPSG